MTFLLLMLLFAYLARSAPVDPADIFNNSTGIITLPFNYGAGVNTNAGADLVTGAVTLSYKCETTWASPRIINIREAAQKLRKPGIGGCVQSNKRGSRCKTQTFYYDAAIGICGGFLSSIPCTDVAAGASIIADRCGWKERAGGQVWYDTQPFARVIVYHAD